VSLDRLAELRDADLPEPRAPAARGSAVARCGRLQTLTPLERRVLVARYARELTLREIGTRVDSPSRAPAACADARCASFAPHARAHSRG